MHTQLISIELEIKASTWKSYELSKGEGDTHLNRALAVSMSMA